MCRMYLYSFLTQTSINKYPDINVWIFFEYLIKSISKCLVIFLQNLKRYFLIQEMHDAEILSQMTDPSLIHIAIIKQKWEHNILTSSAMP